jgi:hypothetical protein
LVLGWTELLRLKPARKSSESTLLWTLDSMIESCDASDDADDVKSDDWDNDLDHMV